MLERSRRLALPIAAALLAAPVSAGEQLRYDIEDDQVFVGYQVSLGRKQLSGVSHGLAGSVAVAGEGARVKLSVPVASFESGFAVADAALRKALEADRHPEIEFEGRADTVSGSEATLQFAGMLRLHGVEQPVTVPVRVIREGRLAFVHLGFSLSLDSFGIPRPSLAGVTVGDKVEVQVVTRLHAAPAGAVLASH